MSVKRSWQLTIALCISAACLVSCSSSAPSSAPATKPPGSPTVDAGVSACRPRAITPSELVLLGDSFFALTRAIPEALMQQARNAGTLAGDASYRDLSAAGAELSTGAILDQYRRAIQTAPVKVAVLSAGLYDLLLGGRCATDDDAGRCSEVATRFTSLLHEMQATGVDDVLYVSYGDATRIGARIKPALDTLRPQLERLCTGSTSPRCRFLDLRPLWQDHPEYTVDGLHPTTAGAQATAQAIWTTLRGQCLAP